MPYAFTEAELAAAPKIVLGGKEFSIPRMAPRQMRLILPALRTFPRQDVIGLSAEDFDRLTGVIHVALTRAYPEITIDDVSDMPISLTDEIPPAMLVIAKACGLKLLKDAPAGEA